MSWISLDWLRMIASARRLTTAWSLRSSSASDICTPPRWCSIMRSRNSVSAATPSARRSSCSNPDYSFNFIVIDPMSAQAIGGAVDAAGSPQRSSQPLI